MSGNAERYPTSAFDYPLPTELIAHHPAVRRDESRLLVIDRADGSLRHRIFRDLVELIPSGDALVLNETRVMPARLLGRRAGGGRAEVLLIRPAPDSDAHERESGGTVWEALVRPGQRLLPGRFVDVAEDLRVEILRTIPDGARLVRLHTRLAAEEAMRRYGHVPLPPYIDRADEPADVERYQTVYARAEGSIAAPTAGLHFTTELLAALEAKGVRIIRLVLHVGIGTFRPVETEDPAEHRLHAEWYSVPAESAAALGAARDAGGAVWAVGTTVVRTLESAAEGSGVVRAGDGWTDLFIRPPYRFRVVDHLITNFHLPRSTLLMLVAAFTGHEVVMNAYREAVERRYRFYSYGDAMAVI